MVPGAEHNPRPRVGDPVCDELRSDSRPRPAASACVSHPAPEDAIVTAVVQPSGSRRRATPSGGPPRRDRFKLTRTERRGLRTGLLFISPWLVGFLAFTLYPAIASLYYSFTNLKILQEPKLDRRWTTTSR